jgi:hypothetical protein
MPTPVDYDPFAKSALKATPVDYDPFAKKKAPEDRGLGTVLTDTAIAVASAAAGGVKSASDFVSPSNSFSNAVDSLIKKGESYESDVVKAAKEKYAKDMENAKSVMDEVAITAKYIKDNPLQSAAMAVGSFAGPGLAIKGAAKASQLLKASEKVSSRLGLGTGIVTSSAMSGGDAAGSAYEMVMQTPNDVLMQNDFIRSQVEGGRSLEDVKKEAATTAARRASVVPALIGGVTGAFGMERVLAGMGGKGAKTAFGTAIKSGLSEAFQEAVEEGATEYSGRAAAQEYDPSIDPMKGVAGAATMGAALGAIPGAGIGVLDARRQLAEQAAQKEAEAQQASQTAEQAAAAIVPQAEQVQAQAQQADAQAQALPFGIVDPNQVQDVLDQAGPQAEDRSQDNLLNAEDQLKLGDIKTQIAAYEAKLEANVDEKGKPLAPRYRENIEGVLTRLRAEEEKLTGGVDAEQLSKSNIEGDQSGAPRLAPAVDETAGGIKTSNDSGVVTVGGPTESITRTEGDQRNALAAEQQAALEAQRLADEQAALAASQVAVNKEEEKNVAQATQAVKAEEKRQKKEPAPDRPEVVQQRATLERLLPKTIGKFTLETITPYAGNWTVKYVSTNESGMTFSQNVPIDAEMLEGKTDAEIEAAIRERATKNGLREPAPTPAPAVNVKGFKKEHMPYVQAEVETRAAEPKSMKEAQQYAAAESAFDSFDVAELVLNREFKEEIAKRNKAARDEYNKNKKLGLPVEAPNPIELHDILTEMTVEDRIKAIEAAEKLGELDTQKRKNQKNEREKFIKSLSQKEQDAIAANTKKILHQEIKSLSKLGKKTASQIRKERTKASTGTSVATAKKGESKPVQAVKVEKKTDSENIIDRQTVESLKTGNTDEILRTIEKGYTDPATKAFATRIKAVVSQFGIQPKIVIGKVEGNRPGSYDGETDTITIDPDAPRGVQLDVVVLHEYGHFLTDRIIDNPENLTPSQKIALDNLKKLHTYVKAELGKQYEIDTLKEFVAQSFTNSEFAVAMGNLPPQSNVLKVQNALKEFATRIMQLLGFKSGDSTLSQTLENVQSILTGSYKDGAKTPGKAKGVSYMSEPKKAEEEPKPLSWEEFKKAQRLPEAPKGAFKSLREFGFSKKFFKRLATNFQNERYEMKDLERELTRSGLLVVGDEKKFNNLYTQTTLAAGNYRTIDNTELKPITNKVYSLIQELMEKSGKDFDVVLQDLSAYGIALHESEVRQVKFLRKIKLRDDINTVEWDGKKISPATAKARIFEELTSKNFATVAKSYGMTPEKLAKEYRKLLEKIVSVDTNIHPDVSKEQRSPDHFDYNVVGNLTPETVKGYLEEANKDKNKDLMDKILKEMSDLSKKTIELNKEANYWSPQVSNLTNFYGYENYVPYKGKLVNEKDKNLFLGEYLGKEYQQAEYTQEGRVSLPDNPVLQMFAEAHLAAARAGRKDVLKSIYHMVQPNELYKDGQGLINAEVKKIIAFEDRYNFEANIELQKLARRENMFFYYMENGDIAVIEMKDDALRDAIRKTYRQSNPILDTLNMINSGIGQMHTRYNVAFAPKNFVRDALTNAYNISAGYSVKAAGRYMGAIAENVTRVGLLHAGKVASAYNKGGADPAKNPAMKKLIDADKSGFTAMLAEYLQYGGDIAYVSSLTTKGQLRDFSKELGRSGKASATKEAIEGFFDSWTSAFEFTSRASAYQIMKAEEVGRLMEKGLTRAQAEKDAIKPAVAAVKNLANFEEVGRFGKVAGAWFMFFRPAATGAVRAIESLAPALASIKGGYKAAAERSWNEAPKNIRDKGSKEEYIKNFVKEAERGKTIAAIAISVGSAIYLMSYFTAGDDEMGRNRVGTDDMSRWQRDARFVVGDGPNDIVNLPWGYGIGALAALGAQITSLGMSDTSFLEVMANAVPIMMDSFLPIPVSKGSPVENPANYLIDSIAPSFLRPIVEFTMNQNSLGQDIYNKRQGPNGNIYTGGDNVPQAYKDASTFLYEVSDFNLPMNPNVAYFFVNSYVDAIGKAVETGYNLYLFGSGQKDFNLKTDTAVLNGMIGVKSNYDARKWSAIEKDMEKRKMRLKEIEDTNDPELYYKYLEANPLDDMLIDMYNGDVGGELKALRTEAQQIRRDRTLDMKTKKLLLDSTKLEENLVKVQLVNMYKAFGVNP